jgi:TRAP-type C4-dicarboxylate transport system permease large subunit
MCVFEMATVAFISHHKTLPALRDQRASFKEVMISLKDSVWSLIIPIIIIVGLRGGLFTPPKERWSL